MLIINKQIKIKKTIQVMICLFIIIMQLITTLSPITKFPSTHIVVTMEDFNMLKAINMWLILGAFGGQFGFFTTWINILAIIMISYAWIFNKKVNVYFKNALIVYLVVIFCGFFCFISPFLKWGQNLWIDYIFVHQHFIIFIIGLWWYFSTPTNQLVNVWKSIKITITLPIIYFIFIFIIYLLSHCSIIPYTFLYFQNVLLLNLQLPYSIVLTIFFLFLIVIFHITINYCFVVINNKKYHKLI